MKKVAFGCDHGGFILKQAVVDTLKLLDAEILDFGCFDKGSVDYPEFALKVAEAVSSSKCDCGVLICGTGIGISIAANKVKGIRCAVCTDTFMAEATKCHNNANVIALGGRIVSPSVASDIVRAWFTAEFEGDRHSKRLNMIGDIEAKYYK